MNSRHVIGIGCVVGCGVATLVYESCWIRQSTLIFGAATMALSTVVAVFFAGMALGSAYFGRHPSNRPLHRAAGMQVALGLYGYASPHVFSAADALFGRLYPHLAHSAIALSGLRIAVVGAVLLIPTILMGATLPLVCGAALRPGRRIGGTVGALYALNTLGAAVGCLACGYWLIPELGITHALQCAAGLYGLCALGLWYASGPHTAPPPRAAANDHAVDRVIYVLFFLSGVVFLGNEVLWTRFLGLLIDNTVHSYTIILTIILLGIVIGSAATAALSDRLQRRALAFGGLQVLFGMVSLAALSLPATWWRGALGDANALRTWLVCGAVLGPPAVLAGAAFPVALRMVVDDPGRAAAGVGQLLAANTFGGIVGSLAVGFILLPGVGLHATLLAITGLSVVIGMIAWIRIERAGVGACLARCAVCTLMWGAVPMWSTTTLPLDYLTHRGELVDFREGLSTHLAVVRRNNDTHLEMNGQWQGRRRRGHQIMAAHVPMILHPEPRRVAVVGLGTGQTASRFLFYDIERLDAIDLEPGLPELISNHFDGAWLGDPRVAVVLQDGRNHLHHTASTYDIISLEVGQIFRPGVASFYTAEFYDHARARLSAGGLLCQFVPLAALRADELRTIVRTFLDAFPEAALWYNTSECILIGRHDGTLSVTTHQLARLTTLAAVHADLQYAHWGGPAQWLNQAGVFLGGFMIGADGLSALAGTGPLYHDDRPVLEYGIQRYPEQAELDTVPLLREHLSPITDILDFTPDNSLVDTARSIRTSNIHDIVASAYRRSAVERQATTLAQRIALLQQAVDANPLDVETLRLLGDALLVSSSAEAEAHYIRAVAIDPLNAIARHHLARALHFQGKLDESIAHYGLAIELTPDDATARANFGAALAAADRLEDALEQLVYALRLRPRFPHAAENFDKVLAQLGNRPARDPRVLAATLLRLAERLDDDSTRDHADRLRRVAQALTDA